MIMNGVDITVDEMTTIKLLHYVLSNYGETNVQKSLNDPTHKFTVHTHSYLGVHIRELSDRGVVDYEETPSMSSSGAHKKEGIGFHNWTVKEEYREYVVLWLI